ncbi:MAG: bifunctional proline dehydrogenase/L-glutamate gamma-semialdehyde dehydrogenase, partial [Bdellovibrionales bacterium]
DMEQYAHKDFTLLLFRELISESDFKNWRDVGVVIQAYLRDSLQDVQKLCVFARQRGTPFTVRLVKGAYWDYETIHARQNNWPIPVYTNKKESDANYEACARLLIENLPVIRVAIGSHNVRSIAAALVAAEERGLSKAAIEVQMLYGMAEPIKRALVKQGYRVREYATIGELIPGMAYLVRRLLENTSNESFLRSKFAENANSALLLANPLNGLVASSPDVAAATNGFRNEPLIDYAVEQERTRFKEALRKTEAELGKTIYPIVGKQTLKPDATLQHHSPAHPQKLVVKAHLAGVKEAEMAVQTARAAFKNWSSVPAENRAAMLEKLANLMNEDRLRLAAIEVHEVGKTWYEADGDITEAIDFCRYYARDMRRLAKPQRVGHAPGEMSLYEYQPRGVVAVIAPWNFPLAILCGMVTAALVTGNTVIMKPAEQSMLIASELHRLLLKAGVPADVVSFLPGLGEVAGDHLVNSPEVDVIAFTGSKTVGLYILQRASVVLPRQRHIKKCIIEMGGKNAIILDSDADLDEAVAGVLYSAFGFSGQKCSACSRVIVLEGIYDRFLDRLVEAAKSIPVGFPESARSSVGPVIDEDAYMRILKTIEKAKAHATLVFQAEAPKEGYFIPPTIFAGVDPKSELAQEEIFGPVLAVIRAKDLSQALEIANDTAYALTGGLFSRSPANIARVKAEFEVGNLYVNRGNTGAMVERHPFGGFKLSGVGSKTGGPDYLLQFVEPRVVTENTMRRGFAPAEE